MGRISNLDSTEQTPAWLLQMRLDGCSYIEVSSGSYSYILHFNDQTQSFYCQQLNLHSFL